MTEPYYQDEQVRLFQGDCLDVLRALPGSSVDAVCTDPPYGLSNVRPAAIVEALTSWSAGKRDVVPAAKGGYLDKAWDSFVPPPAVFDEALRVLKPGGHLLCFAGTRTVDLVGLSIRMAGFEMRDSIGVGGATVAPLMAWLQSEGFPKLKTQLKPSWEPILMARKPLDGTIAKNAEQWGTGNLGIDACRTSTEDRLDRPAGKRTGGAFRFHGFSTIEELRAAAARGERTPDGRSAQATLARIERGYTQPAPATGRWPANAVLTHGVHCEATSCDAGCPVAEVDESQSGASRFFPVFRYQAKASKFERPRVDGVAHPTTKPLALMAWLVRLVTPPDGTILDPFAGSGTTVEAAIDEGFNVIAVEREADYIPLILHRIERANARKAQQVAKVDDEPGLFDLGEAA